LPYKPFLSHKREDADELASLHGELCLRGAGGWQDVAELRVGQRWNAAFKRAIGRETGGFIWYGTRKTLTSRTIRKVEVPAALKRARRERGAYPVVPLFVDLDPTTDGDSIRKAFGRRNTKQLLGLQGVVRGDGENLADFAKRASRQYIRDLVRDHDGDVLRIAITGGRPPTGEHDLSLDWRRLLDVDGRPVDGAAIPTFVETLVDIREAVQTRHACPHIVIEPHLRLPLAALVGWELNRVRPVELTVMQPTGGELLAVEDHPADPNIWASPRTRTPGGSGPAVVAVSVGKDFDDAVIRYATAEDACRVIHLHVPVDDYPDRALRAETICSLAQWTVDRLAELNATGVRKHLVLLGPVSLAVRVGAAANGTGKTFLPVWDGDVGYRSGVMIG
jgi:hypothetical protein